MSSQDLLEMHAVISGRVQGVFFRATTQTHARKLGLTGRVSNMSDGTVEIFAQGSREHLDRLIELLQTDCGFARVDHVEASFSAPGASYDDFRIVR